MSHLPQLPSPDTLPYRLLLLTAISGEFPAAQVGRLPGGPAYKENVVKQLKREKLLRTYYRDGLRGLRLTAAAKSLLLAEQPEQFRPYLTGNAETNALKSELPRRLRLHRMAEVLTVMFNADIFLFNWEKFSVFAPAGAAPPSSIPLPAYYSSREVKGLGPLATQIRGSRSTGILIAPGEVFVVYNTASSLMKWEYRAEMRMKTLLQNEICNRRLPKQFHNAGVQGIVFGSSMEVLPVLMANTAQLRRNYFILDGNFDSFYFLTCDHRGEVILQLLCDPALRTALDGILGENLGPRVPGLPIEHDAVDGRVPVLFAYTCDMPRIKRFDTALELQDIPGVLICFDFQEPILRQICGSQVRFQSIDFDRLEGRLFYPEENLD